MAVRPDELSIVLRGTYRIPPIFVVTKGTALFHCRSLRRRQVTSSFLTFFLIDISGDQCTDPVSLNEQSPTGTAASSPVVVVVVVVLIASILRNSIGKAWRIYPSIASS